MAHEHDMQARHDGLRDILRAIADAESGPFFLGHPDRWYDPHPLYRCPNGHVSKWYVKMGPAGRNACPGCHEAVHLTFNEDTDGPIANRRVCAALFFAAGNHWPRRSPLSWTMTETERRANLLTLARAMQAELTPSAYLERVLPK